MQTSDDIQVGAGVGTADLTDAQRRLLELRLGRRRPGSVTAGAIPCRDPRSVPRMSMAQQGLLLVEELAGGTNAYNVAQALRVRGRLDVDALRRAVDVLVGRHEVLRTRFLVRGADGGGVEILPPTCSDFATTDIDEADMEQFVHEAVSRPFDLGSGRLLRVRLGLLGPLDAVLVLVVHHIGSDAVSKRVLSRELEALYGAFSQGRPDPLAPVPLQYADYAAWMHDHGAPDTELAWWREHLTGVPDQTDLPTDRPRPPEPTLRGASLVERLDATTSDRLRRFGARRGATTYMTLLAGFTAVVERYAAQGEVVVGSTVSGRHTAQLEDVVGLFINTIPVRVDLTGDPDFGTLVDRCRRATVETLRHQGVPLEAIVSDLSPPRVTGRNPFFQTMLTYKTEGNRVPALGGLEVTMLPFEGGWSKLDLSVICYPVGDELSLLWEFSTDLFDEETVRRMARQVVALLRSAVAEPTRPLSSIALTTPADESALAMWNATTVDVAMPLVHELLATQAELRPDAPAVGDDSGWLTYRELDRRANGLAHHLAGLGVGTGSRVAVCMERSVGLEVALFAVLKAGGAYVPLDPSYPADRLAFMLGDCDATVLLTQSWLTERVPHHEQVVLVDEVDTSTLPAGPPEVRVGRGDLAYVIYTSGSTGRPKGVMIEHGGLANHVWWMQQFFGLGADDTVLQKTPFSFDASVWELIWTPTTGARLYMARPGAEGDPWYLASTVETEQVTLVVFVPSMMSAFLDAGVTERCRSLRAVISCGELLPDDVKDACLDGLPWARLVNLYGPTEASVCVTYEECRLGVPGTVGSVMANCRVLVLDERRQQVPPGMPGEIWVGGAQVARGYHDRPELTAQRFVDTDRGRLYRTGDRGTWRPDGSLVYLGRLDQQVKLRGFRVELGEVESVLGSHPGVDDVCAVVREAASGERVIAAYVVLRGDGGELVSEAELTAHARGRLAPYMVPQVVRFLAELPVTTSGKRDRRALLELDLPVSRPRHVAPASRTEAVLAGLWEQRLRTGGPISTDASFFDLGGSSLLALRLFPVIEREFKVKLALAMLFENVTIASMARAIEAERSNQDAWDTLVTIQPHGDRTPLFALPTGRGDALTYRQMAAALDQTRPVHVVESRGLDGRVAARTRIEDIASDALETVRRVQPQGPYHLLGYCYGGVVAYELATQLRAAGEEVGLLCLIDATPFGRGSLSRTQRARRGPRSWSWVRDNVKERFLTHRNVYAAAWFARRGRPIPTRFVNIQSASKVAARTYVTPDSDLHVTLLRVTSGNPAADEARRKRWDDIVGGGCELHLLEGEPVPHLTVIKGRFARQIAHEVNRRLAHSP